MPDGASRLMIDYAKKWGFGGIYVGNLFPYRSTDKNKLLNKRLEVIVPLENSDHQQEMIAKCQLHVLAYGNPIRKDLTIEPKRFGKIWHYLKLTKSGNPCHPLDLDPNLKPIPFNL